MYVFNKAGNQLIRKTYVSDHISCFVCVKTNSSVELLPMYVLQMIVGMTVPHQNAADGAQYAVSAKATTKDDHVSNNDVNKQQENQEVCILYDICMYITIRDWLLKIFLWHIHNRFI